MILDTLFYGRGTLAHGVMPKGLIGYNPDLEPIVYDPKKAKELLAEAGYPDGVDMTLVQVSTWGQTWAKMNELVQAMVKEAGFRVKISQVDESTYYAVRKTGDSDHYMQVWSADFNDPDNFFYTFFSKSGTVVRSFNNNDPEVFEALDRARTITDQKERIALYRELEKKIVHDQASMGALFQYRTPIRACTQGEEIRRSVERLERHVVLRNECRMMSIKVTGAVLQKE